jgi:hypothetical protein
MKKIIFLISFLCLVFRANAQELTIPTNNDLAEVSGARILLENSSYNFGSIESNTPVSHGFTIKNTGNTPLIINRVGTTCGCTASEYPKEPVMPNDSAVIVISYNASTLGVFSKTATVFSNALSGELTLKINGVVEK